MDNSTHDLRTTELLAAALDAHDDDRITLAALMEPLRRRAFGFLLLLLAIPNFIPVPLGIGGVMGVLVIALGLQMLVGLLLYFVFSPLTKAALGDFAGAMKDPLMRFWAVEHVFGMIIGVALAHVGMTRARRAATDALRRSTSRADAVP